MKENQVLFPKLPKEARETHIAAEPTEDEQQAAIDGVSMENADFIPIMTTEASIEFPRHMMYDHAIDFKERITPPWGPIYPVNETEL